MSLSQTWGASQKAYHCGINLGIIRLNMIVEVMEVGKIL